MTIFCIIVICRFIILCYNDCVYYKVGDIVYKSVKYLLSILFVFTIIFINVDGVKAVTTCDYGIQCKYSLSNLRESVGGGYLMGGGYLYVTFQCNDNSKSFSECSSFIAKAAASKQDMSANAFFETGGNPGEDIPISNYNDLFGSNANSFKNNFSTDNKFSCPVMYYIGEESNSKVKLGFSKFGVGASGRTSFTADPLANPSCIEQGVTVDEDDLQDQATDDASNAYADEETGKNDDKDNDGIFGKVDPQTIVDWAQNHGYGNEVTSLGDPCTVINPELQDILSGAFWLISIAGIVLLVVMTAIGFIKAIVGSDDEKLKEAFKHLVTRIIVVIILLLLPMLLTFIIKLINDSAEGEISVGVDGNIFCDVSGSSNNSGSGDTGSGTGVIDEDTGEMTQ